MLLAPQIPTTYATHEPLAIRSIARGSKQVPRYEVVEYRLDLRATYDNPFDSSDVAVDATVQAPSGQTLSVPGFFFRPYARKMVGGKEEMTPSGPGEWRVRFCPAEVGRYTVMIAAKDRTGRVEAKPIRFEAVASKKKGFIRLSPKDKRYFAHDGGQPYYPVGANICWGGDRGAASYDEWLPKYGKQGANYGRLWLGPLWSTFALETSASGFGQFDLGNAWRIDHVLDLARQQGMSLMLCLDSYNTLRDKDAYPQWENTPLSAAHGGPLKAPTEFWSDPQMAKVYRDRLRYVVARYGAATNVFAWEFWNEVDLTRGFDPKTVAAWHARVSQELRDLDPYDHLQTTSFSNSLGFREIDDLPGLDLVQSHSYTGNFVREAAALGKAKGGAKAFFVGEIGADAGGPRAEDKEGVQLHDALWAGIANGHSGTAMVWWWDNLIEPNNLYPLFRPAAEFVKGIDWPAEGFRPAEISLTYAHEEDARGSEDLELLEGPIGFGEAGYNRPQTIVYRDGKIEGEPLGGLLHGVRNHPELHNPVTWDLTLEKPTTLEILVGDVSGWGGANLMVRVDGQTVVQKEFVDPDDREKTDTLKQYAGTIPVAVPAGHHTVQVENTGNDWVNLSYRLQGVLGSPVPPLDVYAIQGPDTAVVWLQVKGRSWRNVVELGQAPSSVPPTRLKLAGLRAGVWRAEIWNTWTGTILSRSILASDHTLTVPQVKRDIAIKLKRT